MSSCSHRRQPAPRITGPLSTNDVAEIILLVLRQRAPVIGQFAPHDLAGWKIRLRERLAGEIRSINSRDGQTANVDFRDRWNQLKGYDYDLERSTNGWNIIGVGSYGPAKKQN
jgi:hypothetical protein